MLTMVKAIHGHKFFGVMILDTSSPDAAAQEPCWEQPWGPKLNSTKANSVKCFLSPTPNTSKRSSQAPPGKKDSE